MNGIGKNCQLPGKEMGGNNFKAICKTIFMHRSNGAIFKWKETSLQGKKNKTSVVVSTAGRGGNHQVLVCRRISVNLFLLIY
jgi:hypothetical protein